MTLRRALGAAAGLAALLGCWPAAARAHPLLLAATPQPGLVAAAAPRTVSLVLSEPAVARGSRIRLYGPGGRELAVGPVRGSDGGRRLAVTPRAPLRSAVYTVRWGALGADGHIVSGSLRFGVAGARGAPPAGVEELTGAGGARGGENAATDGLVKLVARWLGIAGASFLLGAFVLLARLRRGGDGDETLAPLAWLLVALAAAEGLLAAATAGSDGGLDPGLPAASASGVADLARAGVVALGSLALVGARGRPALRARLYAGGGLAVLLTYALSGHVLSAPRAWALLDIAVHVVTAGLWLGGVLAIAVLAARGVVALAVAVRAYAPVAVAALAVAVLSGVFAAVREVDRWYFLRWSDYGRVVLVKAALVALVALLGALAWRRAGRRIVRVEVLGVVAVLALATALSGLAQGRGQPLPAKRGTLFPGPALATALVPGGATAAVGVAPARPGANVVTVGIAPERRTPRAVRVRLVCADCGARPVAARLRAGRGRTWSAPVALPAAGRWFGYVTIDGRRAPPVALSVGVPRAAGAAPIDVLAVADLSGPAADRCRAHVIGLALALARVNADGGLDGGRKVAPLVLDSGGTKAGAAAAARRGLAARPIASAGSCGGGAVAAVEAASRAGLPVVAGDPAVDPTAARDVFRLAADPFVQGLAFGQLVRNRILAAGAPGVRTVRAVAGADAQSRRLLAGLRTGLRSSAAVRGAPVTPGPAPRLQTRPAGALARLAPAALERLLDRRTTTALVVDGPDAGGADARALARVGAARGARLAAAPVLASERVLSETLVRSAGALGRIGALQGVSEVATNTADAELYKAAVPLLFRGEIASLDGLRGYVTGLALRDALRDGTSRAEIVAGLRAPRVFSDALLAPWSARLPGAGSPNVVALQPQFLAPTLVPSSLGGEAKDSEYFPQGSWTVTSALPLGVTAGLRQPPVG